MEPVRAAEAEAAVDKIAATPSTQWRIVVVSSSGPVVATVEATFPTKLAALRYLGPRLSRDDGAVPMLLAPT